MLRLSTAVVLMSLLVGFAQGTAMAAITGKVAVVQDGETFSLVGGQTIRIFGLDAPGLRQRCQQNALHASVVSLCIPCGEGARRALEDLILGKEVQCEPRGENDGQVVGECAYGRVKVGPWMLARGYGVVDGEYMERKDLKAYVGTQRAAKQANAGLWAMSFIPPADWRNHKQRLECER